LAIVRVLTGIVFVSIGLFKVSSMEFAKVIFPDFLESGIRGGSVAWLRPVLEWIMSFGPGRVGITIGFVELFIGIAMFLGLAVRPASLVGMLYSAGLFFATWNQAPTTPSMLQSAEHQFRNLFPFLVFLLLGVGHAGETWGVGSLYHHRRARAWEREAKTGPVQEAPAEAEPKEPGSFEEFVESEARAVGERETAERAVAEREAEWPPAEPRDTSKY
jgi:uncharacterized membrane protein YphA (DoxX/SURF4 family)